MSICKCQVYTYILITQNTSYSCLLEQFSKTEGIPRIATPTLRRLTSPAIHDRELGIPSVFKIVVPSPLCPHCCVVPVGMAGARLGWGMPTAALSLMMLVACSEVSCFLMTASLRSLPSQPRASTKCLGLMLCLIMPGSSRVRFFTGARAVASNPFAFPGAGIIGPPLSKSKSIMYVPVLRFISDQFVPDGSSPLIAHPA